MLLRTWATRRLIVLLTLAAMSLTVMWVSPLGASDATAEDRLIAWINQERRGAGLHDLVVRADLRDVARRHSRRMAEEGELFHNPSRTTEVCCWQKLGENVAYDSDLAELHRDLMSSSGHRANILSPEYTELGVGVEYRDGVFWVTQVFRLRQGETPPPPRTPTPPDPEQTSPEAPHAGSSATPRSAASPPPSHDDRLVLMLSLVDAQEAMALDAASCELADPQPSSVISAICTS
ncbi:MAG: CAP domain-containing protein [Nitriliruptorales bacterium]|nr:CAP domain-containing protein [Nitriliruptorales bacterium]